MLGADPKFVYVILSCCEFAVNFHNGSGGEQFQSNSKHKGGSVERSPHLDQVTLDTFNVAPV